MKIFVKLILLSLFVGIFTHSATASDGCGCGEFIDVEDPITTEVPVSDLSQFATDKKEELKTFAKEEMEKVSVDDAAVSEWVLDVIPDGWGAQKIREAIAEVAAKAAKSLSDEVKNLVPKAVDAYLGIYVAAIDKLTPKGKFQADLRHKENCCDTGEWSRGACNRKGTTQAKGKFSVEIKFKVGASALVEAGTDAKIKISGEAGVSLEPFNPVGPVTGNGNSITIKATPNVLVTGAASAEGGVLVIWGGGAELGVRDTLEDIEGTLNCSEQFFP